MAECELFQDFPDCAKKSWRYLEATQIKLDERERYKYFRHISKVCDEMVACLVLFPSRCLLLLLLIKKVPPRHISKVVSAVGFPCCCCCC